ncbi:putative rRNA methyltransferase YlbH [Candidatus Clavichlamydia salmonicola]|uniref:16S rRNA (guanine(966)-N(2))-methyltransferase RsmD n=1 Tax=Candidatus Clavichlamydia salmonicola TaxID=469812 RepID=UPI001891521F|nr:16S rRNA (guanine(966)-N(2))-methyltransferase RsmD [Candidatus Clavichlamydia salmonicola]MBF5050992.1 putative rRNA methyltransferase YlbH [Candidatus Clavichlamydia salmonicola]
MVLRITAGKHKGRALGVLGKNSIRPTTEALRQKVFDVIQDQIVGAACLDLFAGSGAIGFEALSRGAASVIFVEKSFLGVRSLYNNMELLGEKASVKIVKKDVFPLLKTSFRGTFDFIYVDPPYEILERPRAYKDLFELIIGAKILAPNGVLFFESGDRITPPVGSDVLELRSMRKAGSALLAEYRYKEEVFSN